MGMTNVMVKEIRQLPTGFIVQARWPVGPEPSGYGEVLCKTFEEVILLLRRTTVEMR